KAGHDRMPRKTGRRLQKRRAALDTCIVAPQPPSGLQDLEAVAQLADGEAFSASGASQPRDVPSDEARALGQLDSNAGAHPCTIENDVLLREPFQACAQPDTECRALLRHRPRGSIPLGCAWSRDEHSRALTYGNVNLQAIAASDSAGRM